MLRGCNLRSTFSLCSVSLRQHGSRGVPCAHQYSSTPTVRCSATSTVGSKYSSLEYTSQLQSEIDRLSDAPMVPRSPSLVFVVSGPSGVGKDAAIKELQRVRPGLHFVVTATSRPMRKGEVEGVDYTFVSKEQFEKWIHEDKLLEHALVYGEYKGILRSQVVTALENNQDVLLRLDIQGAATMRKLMPGLTSIFVVAESQRALVHRLLERKTETLDKLLVRVKTANAETDHLKEFDYVVVNSDGKLQQCVQQMDAIIQAEKCKRQRLYPLDQE